MKQRKVTVVIQVPCLNEAKTLPLVFKKMPKQIPGVDKVIWQIIDDGSTDKTTQVAHKLGVKHVVSHTRTEGLGRSFYDGVMNALALGADIVVNTDGDNQYPSERIGDLVQPILKGKADIVIGDRQVHTIAHFSGPKVLMQRVGSWVVNKAAGTNIPDAASGFRAYSSESLIKLNTVTRFSYCMETIIQAGHKRLAITSIPVKTNAKTRESRLFSSNFEHVLKSSMAIIRSYLMYRPYVLFNTLGGLIGLLGLAPFGRYFYFYLHHEHGSHLQSLVVGAVLLTAAFTSISLGVIADLVRINRVLNENALEILKRQRFEK